MARRGANFWKNLLDKGVKEFNEYRKSNPQAIPKFGVRKGVREWIDYLNLDGINLSGASLEGTIWVKKTSMIKANLSKARLNRAQMFGVNLASANLANIDWPNGILEEVNLSGVKLSGAVLSRSYMRRLIIDEQTDLRRVVLRNSVFSYVDFLRKFDMTNSPISLELRREIEQWRVIFDEQDHYIDLESIRKLPSRVPGLVWKDLAQALGMKITLK